MGPVDLAITRKPIQQHEVSQVPNSDMLRIAQTPPTSHSRTATQLFRQHPPGNAPLRSTNRIPVRQARSDTRGRPPCGFGIEAGRSGRIKLHRASGTSAAAITIPPRREGQTLGLYKGRCCYRHLGSHVDRLERPPTFRSHSEMSGGYLSDQR